MAEIPERYRVNSRATGVPARQLTPDLGSDHEDPLAIGAWQWSVGGNGTCCQPHRFVVDPSEKAFPFPNRPDVSDSAPYRLEQEVFAIRRPTPATLSRRLVPSEKQRLEIFSVC